MKISLAHRAPRSCFGLMLVVCLSSALVVGCNGDSAGDGATTVSGTIEQAANIQVFLDQVNGPVAATVPVAKTTADADGHFAMELPVAPEAGAYRLRIGALKVPLLLDGDEEQVDITGSMAGLAKYEYAVKGAASASSFQSLLSGLANRSYDASDIEQYADTAQNAFAGAYAAQLSLVDGGKFIGTHLKAAERLKRDAPDATFTQDYGSFVASAQAQVAAQQAQDLIKVGAIAPDITLQNPDGESFSLSDLKGKVVLLDFWAAWCGPCRRENPNVVRIYDKYEKQGFTVFSVSLDGIDDRSRARFQTEEQFDKALTQQRDRWVNAIAQDKLRWPYHVSDLKKWSSLAVSTYGVSAIPRTFLIDRDGRIAEINPRGRLEQAVTAIL